MSASLFIVSEQILILVNADNDAWILQGVIQLTFNKVQTILYWQSMSDLVWDYPSITKLTLHANAEMNQTGSLRTFFYELRMTLGYQLDHLLSLRP